MSSARADQFEQTNTPRALALEAVNRAEAVEEKARQRERAAALTTGISAPVVAGGVAVAVVAAHAAVLAGVIATGGVFLFLALLGLAIYLLVFRRNENAAHVEHMAAEKTLLGIPPPIVPEPVVVPPPATATLPPRPAYVQKPNAIQIALDKVMAQAKAHYAWIDAAGKPQSANVTPGFRMVDGYKQPTPKEAAALITATLKDADLWKQPYAYSLGRLSIGRASLADIAKFTGLLIQAKGIVPEPRFTGRLAYWAAVRELMWQYGLGLDCAGYTSEAVATIHKKGMSDPALDNVFLMGNEFDPQVDRNFKTVPTDAMLSGLQPGDLLRLKDPDGDVGHFLVTYETHALTDADKAYYASAIIDPAGWLAGGPVQLYVFDSSWGAGGDPTQPQAGVSRHVLFYNQATQQWSQLITSRGQSTPRIAATDGPYDHIVLGVHRFID